MPDVLEARNKALYELIPEDVIPERVAGGFAFTDPPYAVSANLVREPGWWSKPLFGKQLEVNGVYRLAADGSLTLLADDFDLPNGLAFSPDEKVLYVDDSQKKHIRAFDVVPDG